jgi:hypothetical protein
MYYGFYGGRNGEHFYRCVEEKVILFFRLRQIFFSTQYLSDQSIDALEKTAFQIFAVGVLNCISSLIDLKETESFLSGHRLRQIFSAQPYQLGQSIDAQDKCALRLFAAGAIKAYFCASDQIKQSTA